MLTLALANFKGGTGKTSLAVHLAMGFARDRRALLVDLDHQGHATRWLLPEQPTRGIADAIRAGAADKRDLVTVGQGKTKMTMAPATPELREIELFLSAEIGGVAILGNVLKGLRDDFDVVILDCPPSSGLVVLAAVCAADAVIAPVLPAFLSLSGLSSLEETVTRARQRLKVHTRMLGCVLFAADPRESITAESREVLGRVRGRLYASEVRVSTAGKALPASHRTAWDGDADPRGLDDYTAVLAETKSRLRERRRPL